MKNLLVIFCFFSLAATCQDQNSDSKDSNKNPCSPDIICTMQFKIINLEIENGEGEPIVLDEFYSKIDDKTIEIPYDVYELKEGLYPVVTDGQMAALEFEGTEIIFFGLINGETVVEHKMTIGKDCCHIELLDGDKKIILSL